MIAPDLPADAWPNMRPARRFTVALPEAVYRRDTARARDEHPVAEVLATRYGVQLSNPSAARRYGMCKCDPKRGRKQLWVNTQTQTWGCFAAGSTCGGDVLSMLEQFDGLSFKDAYDLLMGVDTVSVDPEEAARRDAERAARKAEMAREAAAHDEREREKAYAIWRAAGPTEGTLADAYCRHRGLAPFASKALRFSPDEAYWHEDADGRPQVIHRGPCLVAAIQDAAGRFCGLHRTWLDPRLADRACPAETLPTDASGKASLVDPVSGAPLPAKKMRGGKQGGAIRLHDDDGAATGRRGFLCGEGIETTETVWQALRARPATPGAAAVAWYAWAAGDLGNLSGGGLGPSTPHPEKPGRLVPPAEPDPARPGLMPPRWADRAILLGDGDSDPHVTGARLACAKARWEAAGIPTTIVMAPRGADFNDLVRR